MTENLKTLHVTPNKSNNIFDPARLPWDISPYGVVSLLAMLRFYAERFCSSSSLLGQIYAQVKSGTRPTDESWGRVGGALGALERECQAMGLAVTLAQIKRIKSIFTEGASNVNYDNLARDVLEVQLRLNDELESRLCYCVETEKSTYCKSAWLTDTTLFKKYPEILDEFQRAGRCFAYGENTACIFHLMRVTDFLLGKVADSLKVQYDTRNWHAIGEKISREMEKKYQAKTDDWKKKEPFYAQILTDIQAIGRGHRNPALHELEKKYDEREALYMLTVIEGFATHIAEKLSPPPPPATELAGH